MDRRTARMLQDGLWDRVERRLGVVWIGCDRAMRRGRAALGWVLTEETGENLGGLVCFAWEGKALDKIARARGNAGRTLFDQGGSLNACSLSSPSKLVQHRHRRVQ